MKYDPAASIQIPIRSLTVGMFVTAIEDNKRVNLANAGRVSTSSSIAQLVHRGIKFAWVDVSLSAKHCRFPSLSENALSRSNLKVAATKECVSEHQDLAIELNGVEPQNHIEAHTVRKFGQHVRGRAKTLFSRDANQKRARKIVKEARSLAKKLLNQTFDGKLVEIDELNQWADELIESVLVDSDALQCVSALRSKDQYLLEHSVNVACLLVTFGKYLGLDKPMLKDLAVGGIVHDIGKIKVDNSILHKPGKLNAKEFEHMKMHQVFAQDMKTVKALNQVSRDVCLMHHEKVDGTGYPLGLKGDELPVHGRMSAIVDIYDALTADRCYKKAMSSAEAFKVLLSLTPNHLDRELVYKFINCIGVYPVGSVVELSDHRLGIVWVSNQADPLKPEVKCFYSTKYTRFTEVTFVDLKKGSMTINRAVSPTALDIDISPFFL